MTTSSDGKHDIFRRDPEALMQYVNCRVNIVTIDGRQHTGRVYTVDPVSSTFVLLRCACEGTADESWTPKSGAELVLGHAVRSVEVLSGDGCVHRPDMNAMFKPVRKAHTDEAETLAGHCERLERWLVQNRVPVERAKGQPEVLTIGGDVLTIEPPYGVDCCMSTNEIILARVQSLIKNMPCATGSS